MSADDVVDEALRLAGVVDGHNDLPWASREGHGYSTKGLDSGVSSLHTDVRG